MYRNMCGCYGPFTAYQRLNVRGLIRYPGSFWGGSWSGKNVIFERTLRYSLYTPYSHIPCIIYYIPYTLHHILHTIHSLSYTIYHIRAPNARRFPHQTFAKRLFCGKRLVRRRPVSVAMVTSRPSMADTSCCQQKILKFWEAPKSRKYSIVCHNMV